MSLPRPWRPCGICTTLTNQVYHPDGRCPRPRDPWSTPIVYFDELPPSSVASVDFGSISVDVTRFLRNYERDLMAYLFGCRGPDPQRGAMSTPEFAKPLAPPNKALPQYKTTEERLKGFYERADAAIENKGDSDDRCR